MTVVCKRGWVTIFQERVVSIDSAIPPPPQKKKKKKKLRKHMLMYSGTSLCLGPECVQISEMFGSVKYAHGFNEALCSLMNTKGPPSVWISEV